MPLPAGWTTVPITATYASRDGVTPSGKVKFYSQQVVVVAGVTVVPTLIEATLDAAGSISLLLPATDDPDIAPQGFVYTVQELINGATVRAPFNIAVPHASAGIDLATVAPVIVDVAGALVAPGPPGAPAEWEQVTQAQYDALAPPDAATLYVVIG